MGGADLQHQLVGVAQIHPLDQGALGGMTQVTDEAMDAAERDAEHD